MRLNPPGLHQYRYGVSQADWNKLPAKPRVVVQMQGNDPPPYLAYGSLIGSCGG